MVRQNIKEVVKVTIALFITARSFGPPAKKANGAKTVVQHVNASSYPLSSGRDTKLVIHTMMMVRMSGTRVQ